MLSGAITSENLASIGSDFWASMLALPISPVANLPAVQSDEEGILGRIEIRGAWTGVVEVRASRGLARATAAALLDKLPTDVTVEECFDATQEATNIVAGSIKRLLPSICKMAIPAMSGCSSLSSTPQFPALLTVFFVSPCGQLAITVGNREG